ncbi:MAG: Unknown protein [uncultured Campylobacterales bacterium]|uniref:Type II secretion system protein n=1 Tax=uncultured Campylobacterales bacterium TaxID=352960 RepID=A0A6S6TER5_9BACT|nr:MAG: Unknown protein [uncultured Campylobacterales bacterium]
MRKGFTMIELIFVIVILGILATVAIPKIMATRDDAKITTIVANVEMMKNEVSSYVMSQGQVAENAAGTEVLLEDMSQTIAKMLSADPDPDGDGAFDDDTSTMTPLATTIEPNPSAVASKVYKVKTATGESGLTCLRVGIPSDPDDADALFIRIDTDADDPICSQVNLQITDVDIPLRGQQVVR